MGEDPDSGLPIYLKTGRFGPYVQLGDDDANDGKPRRASLWPSMSMQSLALDEALLLLSFPKSLGAHPESGVEVVAQDGPNGPYLKMGDETRSLRDHDHLQSATLDEALSMFAQPKTRGRRPGPAELAALGEHPASGEPVRLLKGRFGPYVTDGAVNASIPKGRDPASVTLDEAVELIAAREQRLRDQARTRARPGRSASAAAARRSGSGRRSGRRWFFRPVRSLFRASVPRARSWRADVQPRRIVGAVYRATLMSPAAGCGAWLFPSLPTTIAGAPRSNATSTTWRA